MNLQSSHRGIVHQLRDGRSHANSFGRGDAHPRVTGCHAVHKAFRTIVDARAYMEKNKIFNFKEVIKSREDTTPEVDTAAYYAVAHGAKPGIHEKW